MKKFLSLVLVFAMMIGCCSALAADTESRSANATVTVKHFVVERSAATESTLLYEERSSTAISEISLVTNRNNIDLTSYIKFSAEGIDEETFTSNKITADEIIDYASKSNKDYVLVTITVTSVKAKNNDITSDAEIESNEAFNVLVINKSKVDDDNPTDGEHKGLIFSTITINTTEAYPGDTIEVTANTEESANNPSGITVTVDRTELYQTIDNGSATKLNFDQNGAHIEYSKLVEEEDIGNTYTYWAIGYATVTKK